MYNFPKSETREAYLRLTRSFSILEKDIERLHTFLNIAVLSNVDFKECVKGFVNLIKDDASVLDCYISSLRNLQWKFKKES